MSDQGRGVEEPEEEVVDLDALLEDEEPLSDETEESLDHLLEIQFSGEEVISPEMAEERRAEDRDLAAATGAAHPPVTEFLCRQCFLRKAASQFADPAARLCQDCANAR